MLRPGKRRENGISVPDEDRRSQKWLSRLVIRHGNLYEFMQRPYFPANLIIQFIVTKIKGSALFVHRNIGFIEFRVVSMIFRRFLYFSSVGAAPGFFISHPHPAQPQNGFSVITRAPLMEFPIDCSPGPFPLFFLYLRIPFPIWY